MKLLEALGLIENTHDIDYAADVPWVRDVRALVPWATAVKRIPIPGTSAWMYDFKSPDRESSFLRVAWPSIEQARREIPTMWPGRTYQDISGRIIPDVTIDKYTGKSMVFWPVDILTLERLRGARVGFRSAPWIPLDQAVSESTHDIDYTPAPTDLKRTINAEIGAIVQDRFHKFRGRDLLPLSIRPRTLSGILLDNGIELYRRAHGQLVARVRYWPTFESWESFNREEHDTWIPWRGQMKYGTDVWIEPLWVKDVDLAGAGFKKAP